MNPTERFTERAQDYVAGRPSYPEAAFEVLFEGLGAPGDVLVADLGAGTGISSRLLAQRGAQVLAVEPNAAMRAAADPHPRVEWLAATAEATGIGEAAVDLVTAFQAFHWFHHGATFREIVRILRPGGRAAVVYNERDESDPFTAAYGAIVQRYKTDDTESRRAETLRAFADFEGWQSPCSFRFPNAMEGDLEGVLARARSSSYLPKEGPSAEAMFAEIRALFERYAIDGRVTMAMQTLVARGESGAG